MHIYEVKYLKECEYIMVVEAKDEKEAREKFEKFDCIKEYEHQCIHEELIEVYCNAEKSSLKISENDKVCK